MFVLKPAAWNPPAFGTGNGTAAIGIGGMSVGECVKIRERQRMKEREAQRVAAVEAKASRDAAKALSDGSSSAGDGWAQVAASSRRGVGVGAATTPGSRSGTATPGYGQSTPFSGSMFAALAAGGGDGGAAASSGPKKERLVLRSGVGAGKQLKSQAPPPEPIADSWEEEVEKEEKEEKEEQQEREKGSDMSDGAEQGQENEAGAEGETEAEAA